MGLVGQIRHDKKRADDYEGLQVTLKGDTEPLPTDSAAVNDRVANWFGFRPHGPENKHIEFYRVNYHEAGAATRFIENDPDIDIERTLRRLLFGEELEDARNHKEKLLPRLRTKIEEAEDRIAELESDKLELEETQERVSEVFSHLKIAAEDLSPAAKAALSTEPDAPDSESGNSPAPENLKKWARWEQQFSDIQAGLEAMRKLGAEVDSLTTPGGLRRGLLEAREDVERATADIANLKDLEAERTKLSDLIDNMGQSIDMVPASVGLVALILHSHRFDADDLTTIQMCLDEANESDEALEKAGSIEEWRDNCVTQVTQRLDALRDKKARIEKLDELDKRRRELQAQIRNKTEEYLSITDDTHYCPACYTEQSRDAILNREKPEHLHGDPSEGVPDPVLDRISMLERAQRILNSPHWEDVDYDITVRFNNLCGMDAFRRLWRSSSIEDVAAIVASRVTTSTVEAFATALRESTDISTGPPSSKQVIETRIDNLETSISELMATIPAVAGPDADVKQLEEHFQHLADDINASEDILEEHWQGDARTKQLDVESDYRTLRRALDEVKRSPSALEEPSHYIEQLNDVDAEISELHETIENCQDGIDRMEYVFQGTGGEEELKSLVADHMTVISTLFKAFQRPYEFERVRFNGDHVVVDRRGENDTMEVSEMSSGQRAALALAIFVTNNIAHERAPALMMLDEPFAHLDDINTVAFFNLLIELARMGSRQIIFATANADMADLLQRKVGETKDFARVDIPMTAPTPDAG